MFAIESEIYYIRVDFMYGVRKVLLKRQKKWQGFVTRSSLSLFVVQLKSGRNRPKTFTLILLNEQKEFNLT